MSQLMAGDVVFTEAGHMKISRHIISAVSGGSKTVHVAIASGNGTYVFESVPPKVRCNPLSIKDSYTVYRNKSTQNQKLIAMIAEGFCANVSHVGGNYGSYSKGSATLTGLFGSRRGEENQWGNNTTSSFYCSNFVARVLMAAKQSGGGSVYSTPLDRHILPVDLKTYLESDPCWSKIV